MEAEFPIFSISTSDGGWLTSQSAPASTGYVIGCAPGPTVKRKISAAAEPEHPNVLLSCYCVLDFMKRTQLYPAPNLMVCCKADDNLRW
jgi:hypothetical protein